MDQRQIDVALAEVDAAQLGRFTRASNRLLAAPPATAGDALRTRQPGRSLEFLDHVPYAAGADARTVDWRASARSRRLLVRRYHHEMTSRWYLCLDGSASMGLPDAGKWLRAIQLAAAFSYLLLHRGNRVGVMTFSDRLDGLLPARRGRSHYARILRGLSRWRPREQGGGSALLSCLPHVARRCSAVVLSDFLSSDALCSDLDRLVARGGAVHALQVLAPKECELETDGVVAIQDVETGARRTVDAALGSAQALTRLGAQQQALARHCEARRVRHSACSTDASWVSLLMQHMERGVGDA